MEGTYPIGTRFRAYVRNVMTEKYTEFELVPNGLLTHEQVERRVKYWLDEDVELIKLEVVHISESSSGA